MIGLRFEDQPPRVISDPNRADIACFIGFVGRRATALPAEVGRWLYERQWLASADTPSDLLNLPTPIDTWEIFDLLFAWEMRPLGSQDERIPTYLGAAVRSYFAQGGRKCYVVRVGDPWPYLEAPTDRDATINQRIGQLLPGYSGSVIAASPVDPQAWRGIAHLFGLTDVSFLCLPDLAEIVRNPQPKIDPQVELPPEPEQFVECSDELPAAEDRLARRVNAPNSDETGYLAWTKAIGVCAQFLHRMQREVQLVASVPLPEAGSDAEHNLLDYLNTLDGTPLLLSPKQTATGMASAFVQLAYPWLRTSASAPLPQGLESPDGVLTGLLARNALARGAFRSAANLPPVDVQELTPALNRHQIETLAERVSLFGFTPDGLRLLSDVTTSLQSSYRQAHINRLISTLVRAARSLGEEILFDPSGERLWAQISDQLRWLLEGFRTAGALRGESADDAYFVRCDRSTMTQNDIDNGRVVAQIQVDPAAAIDAITVVLAMDEGGQVSLVGQT